MSAREATQISIRVVTGLHFARSLMAELNHLTFLLDPSWKAESNRKPTLPVVFMKVIAQDEIFETQFTEKPIMLNNDTWSSYLGTDNAVTQVVSDNVINKPRVWKIKCILPRTSVLGDNLLSNFSVTQIAALNDVAFNPIGSASSGNRVASTIMSYIAQVTGIATSIAQKVFTMLEQPAATNIRDSVLGLTEVPDYNKNSLIRMWQNRAIIKMKLWNSWEYKHVAITNLSIHDEGKNQNVSEAEITVQEVPILSFGTSYTALQKESIEEGEHFSPINIKGILLKNLLEGLDEGR